MRITQEEIKQMIEEEAARFLDEEANPDKVDPKRFPMKLTQVDPGNAEIYTTRGHSKYDGNPTDDEISTNKNFAASVGSLKPSQSSMNIGKALGMALGMIMGKENGGMPIGGNLGAFISDDDYIMDGHHRWIATAMVDPSEKVGGIQVGFPGKELVAILNAMTAGQFGRTKGKAGSGGFDQFEEGPIKKQLLDFLKGGTPGKFGKGPDWVKNAIETFTGKTVEEDGVALDAAVDKFLANLDTIKPLAGNLLPGAPEREDMPVIDDEETSGAVDATVNALEKGLIDVNPPYYTDEDEPGDTPPMEESKSYSSKINITVGKLKEIIKEELANRKKSK